MALTLVAEGGLVSRCAEYARLNVTGMSRGGREVVGILRGIGGEGGCGGGGNGVEVGGDEGGDRYDYPCWK